jgi:hypothetical protein
VTPNRCIDRSAQQLRRWVPVARCAPAPGHAGRFGIRGSSSEIHRLLEVLRAWITERLPGSGARTTCPGVWKPEVSQREEETPHGYLDI